MKRMKGSIIVFMSLLFTTGVYAADVAKVDDTTFNVTTVVPQATVVRKMSLDQIKSQEKSIQFQITRLQANLANLQDLDTKATAAGVKTQADAKKVS